MCGDDDSSEGIVIRPIGPDDGPRMYDLFRRMSPRSRKYFWPHPFTPDAAEAWAKRASDPEYVVRVAVGQDGRLGGYTWYHRADERLPLVGIGLTDDAQGRGLGRRLLETLADEARRTGRGGIRLTVHKENRRAQALYSRCGFRFSREDASHHDYFMELLFAEASPAFVTRGMYVDGIPWNLTGLTPDTWTVEDWQWYLRLLQAAGCNLLKLYIWPTQLFHPDDPRTAHNGWRYDVYGEVLAWAKIWNFRTLVAFTNTAVPPHVWHARLGERAAGASHQGMDLCWNRGRRTLLKYQKYLIDTFAPVSDGVLVWFRGPGYCRCSLCTDHAQVVRDCVQTYREILAGRGQVHVSLRGLERRERRAESSDVIPGFPRRVIESLSAGTLLLIPDDTEPDVRRLAADRGLSLLTTARHQDPEAALENGSVLPNPRFVVTDRFIRDQRTQGSRHLVGYESAPFTQFPADWIMLRKMVHPGLDAEQSLEGLGTYLFGNSGTGRPEADARTFVEAICKIDQWWQGRHVATPERDHLLAEAVEDLGAITWAYDAPLCALADATRVLLELSRVRSRGGSDIDALAVRVQDMMTNMAVFRGVVQGQLWEPTWVRHSVRERVRWWLETLLD